MLYLSGPGPSKPVMPDPNQPLVGSEKRASDKHCSKRTQLWARLHRAIGVSVPTLGSIRPKGSGFRVWGLRVSQPPDLLPSIRIAKPRQASGCTPKEGARDPGSKGLLLLLHLPESLSRSNQDTSRVAPDGSSQNSLSIASRQPVWNLLQLTEKVHG